MEFILIELSICCVGVYQKRLTCVKVYSRNSVVLYTLQFIDSYTYVRACPRAFVSAVIRYS